MSINLTFLKQLRVLAGALLYFTFLSRAQCQCLTISSISDGDWNDALIWSCGRAPRAGDFVRLRHTITVPTGLTVSAKSLIYVGGRLVLSNQATFRFDTTSTQPTYTVQTLGGKEEDMLHCIISINDGGFLATGTKTRDNRLQAGWVLKLDATGGVIWEKLLPPPPDPNNFSGHNVLLSAVQTSDNGYLVTGACNGYPWLMRLDAQGGVVWNKSYYSTNTFIKKVLTTSDGNFLVVGHTNSRQFIPDVTLNELAGWMAKIDANGNIIWHQEILFKSTISMFNDVAESADGSYIAVGYAGYDYANKKNYAIGAGTDAWLVKVSSSGALQWDKGFNNENNAGYDTFESIIMTAGQEMLVAGAASHSKSPYQSGSDAWLLKFSATGNSLWEKTFGGTGEDRFTSIRAVANNTYIIGGKAHSAEIKPLASDRYKSAWAMLVTGDGIQQWQRFFGACSTEVSPNGATPGEVVTSICSKNDVYTAVGYTYSVDGDIRLNHGAGDGLMISFKADR